MKVILYIATSINGYITYGLENSDWVSKVDWQEFDALKNRCKVLVMGRKTFYQVGSDFPYQGALNIVMTHNQELLRNEVSGALFTDKTPKEVVKMCEEKGFKELMLIGGMELNTSFLKDNLINEVWLSVHPLLIGDGLSVVQKFDYFKDLEFLESKQMDQGLVRLKYKIK